MATADAEVQERLMSRLTEPATAEAIGRILDRLELVAFGLDATDGFLRRGEGLADSMGEGLRELRRAAASAPGLAESVARLPQLVETGEQLAEVARHPGVRNLLASGLLDRLGEPKTIDALKSLLDRLELISYLVMALDGFLSRGEQFTDALAGGLTDLRKIAAGVDTSRVAGLYDGLPKVVDAGLGLIDSGMLEREVVQVLGELGRTAATAYDEYQVDPALRRPMGLWGLLKALRDPEVQRATGVLLHVAKRFGESLTAAPTDGRTASS